MRRIIIYLRISFVICAGVVLGGLVGGAAYLNQSGLDHFWRAHISQELENLGIFADFQKLSIEFDKGLVANGVKIYAGPKRKDLVAELGHLVIDVDKSKLVLGKIDVNKVSLKKSTIKLHKHAGNTILPVVSIENLEGDFYFSDANSILVQNFSVLVEGINVSIDAQVWHDASNSSEDPDDSPIAHELVFEKFAHILKRLKQWRWPNNTPPHIKLYVEFDVNKPKSSRLEFTLSAKQIDHESIVLRDINIQGDYHNNLLSLEHISLKDGMGKLQARAAYHPRIKQARFSAYSSLHLQKLFRQLVDLDLFSEVTFSTPPEFEGVGKIDFPENGKIKFNASGRATANNLSFMGTSYRKIQTEFSINGNDFYLTKLKVAHSHGEFQGKLLVKNETIRFKAQSTLPPESYTAFIKGSALEKALSKVSFKPNSKLKIDLEGTMNRRNYSEWEAHGKTHIENLTYKTTSLKSLKTEFDLSSLLLLFSNASAVFDYSNYPMRTKYKGVLSALAQVNEVKVDLSKNLVSISNINGTFWPAPLVRFFSKEVANYLENYMFHHPPSLRASGTFDTRSSFSNTDFRITLRSHGLTNYKFLGKYLNIKDLLANVRIRKKFVHIDDLKFKIWNGSCKGDIHVDVSKRNSSPFRGGMQWDNIHLNEISKTYNFGSAEDGLLTGRLDFSGDEDKLYKFNAAGSIGLEKGNLFSIPMLGPISSLLKSTLGNKYSITERAKNASSSFLIKNGIIYTNNLTATSRSLKFTGEGNINMITKRMDFLMRMNARGLMGVITFPLQPFIGLFQFKGTGSVSAPKWRATLFTEPSRGKKAQIYKTPPRASVFSQ